MSIVQNTKRALFLLKWYVPNTKPICLTCLCISVSNVREGFPELTQAMIDEFWYHSASELFSLLFQTCTIKLFSYKKKKYLLIQL